MTEERDVDAPEYVVTFADFRAMLHRHAKKIKFCSCAFALAALLFALTKPLMYETKAVFHQKGRSASGINTDMFQTLFSMQQPESEAIIAMRSLRLSRDLAKAHGLQAKIERDMPRFPFLPVGTILDNVTLELALLRGARFPVIDDKEPSIAARSVVYDKITPMSLQLEVTSPDTYTLRNGWTVIGQGMFGHLLTTDDFSVLLENPGGESYGSYIMDLLPLDKVAERIQKTFVISSDLNDKNLINITYRNPSRKLAVDHVNTLMDLYQKYVDDEHQRIAVAQLDYLLERQQSMGNQLRVMMQDHANALSTDLTTTGFATSGMAMEFFEKNQQSLQQQLLTTELEIQRLERISRSATDFDKFLAISASEWSTQFAAEMRSLKQQADSLSMALSSVAAPSEDESMILANPNTAKDLYIAYCREMCDVESKALKIKYVIGHLDNPNFELSSLSTILDDPTSAEMINKAANTSLALKDVENRSSKEQDRLKADLELQKQFLSSHLKHSIDLLELNHELLKKKIYSLQSISLSLLQNEMAVLEHEMKQYVLSSIEALRMEKTLLEQNLDDLHRQMASLPQKWATEQFIEQQMEINKNMIEEISKLVETKNITSNLEKIQSVPLDVPGHPLHPASPRILLYTMIGALLGAFLGVLWAVGASVMHGVYASLGNMRALHHHISGTLSPQCSSKVAELVDSDLETLRRVASFTHEGVLLLLESDGPNYAPALAELLHKSGKKVVIVDISFDKPSAPGMLQYLEDSIDSLPISHSHGYDEVYAGGMCRYANELLTNARLQDAVKYLTDHYDWVLFVSRCSLASAEAQTLVDLFPRAVITLGSVTLKDLTPLLHRAFSVTFLDQRDAF